jgi:sensor histidine kinase regulating citrate/malate metabolism
VILCLIILKKINSLLIELGPLAVKTFLLDLKSDLIATNGGILGQKREEAIKIINQYCRRHLKTLNDTNDSFYLDSTVSESISKKLQKLVQILNESYEKDPKLKTIIFVKDRSVAVYLKKLLFGNQPERNF